MCLRLGNGLPEVIIVIVVDHDPKFTSDVFRRRLEGDFHSGIRTIVKSMGLS